MAWIGLDRDHTAVPRVLGNDLARASDLIGKEADVELDHLLAEFLADRPELLEESGEHKREFEELIAESDLPDEARAMLAAAS